jgi:UMF1 family MFS transporter
MKTKSSLWAWCLYDFANSAYAVSVLTFIFPFFFKDVLVGKGKSILIWGSEWSGAAVYPIMISLSLGVVFLLVPILAKIADEKAIRKNTLAYFWVLGFVSTMLMFFLKEGNWLLGMILFLLANIGFAGGNVFYNALIKEISTDETLGKVSGQGWALGYLGGFLALIIELILILNHEAFGLDKVFATRLSFLITGIWWFIFGIPLFYKVEESHATKEKSELSLLEVVITLKKALTYPALGLFLLAFFMYNDAVQTTISQAGNLAGEMLGMPLTDVMTAGIAIQFLAIFGSLLFLWIEKKWGTLFSLKLALVNWIFIMVWAMLMTTSTEFYVLCMWVGLVMGVTQSGSRTLFGKFVPKDQSARFYALYTVTDRASAMIGPVLFGLAVNYLSIRWGIFPLLVMVIIGLFCLHLLHKKHQRII